VSSAVSSVCAFWWALSRMWSSSAACVICCSRPPHLRFKIGIGWHQQARGARVDPRARVIDAGRKHLRSRKMHLYRIPWTVTLPGWSWLRSTPAMTRRAPRAAACHRQESQEGRGFRDHRRRSCRERTRPSQDARAYGFSQPPKATSVDARSPARKVSRNSIPKAALRNMRPTPQQEKSEDDSECQ